VRVRAAQAAHTADPRPPKFALAPALIAIIAAWAGARPVRVVADHVDAGRTMLDDRPPNGPLSSRLRMDAALWTSPARRRPGQRGRCRRRGVRLPTAAALAATCRRWRPVPVTRSRSGRAVTVPVFLGRALWEVARRDQPVRSGIVRDRSGRRHDEAFVSPDGTMAAAGMLERDARRWTLVVTFHDTKPCLGLEDAPTQSRPAAQKTAPLACLVCGRVLRWYAGRVQQGTTGRWVSRPWYATKAAPSCADMLTAPRVAGWRPSISEPPSPQRRPKNAVTPWPDAVLATA